MDKQQVMYCCDFINFAMRVGCKALSRWTPDGWIVTVTWALNDFIELRSMHDVYVFIAGYANSVDIE